MLNYNDPKDVEAFNKGIDRAALVNSCKHFVLDMDGTFYLGNTILPGSLDFLKTLESPAVTGADDHSGEPFYE